MEKPPDQNYTFEKDDMKDEPIFTIEQLSDWFWGFLRAVGVIASLIAVLWFLGKVH